MAPRKRAIFFLASLLLLTLACAAPVLAVTPTARPELVFPTAVALISSTPITPSPSLTASLVAAVTVTITPSVTPTATVADTPATPGNFPRVGFVHTTNCRLGPAVNYFQKTVFLADRTMLAEGRNGDSSWLWVRVNRTDQHCWVSLTNIKNPVNYDALPEVEFPPLPEAPSPMHVEKKNCASRNTVLLQWADIPNETGFHFFRNGIMLALLKADATSYEDYPPAGREYFYEIESINNYGLSVRVPLKVPGCSP